MARSRYVALVGVLATGLAACDVLLGLGGYTEPTCNPAEHDCPDAAAVDVTVEAPAEAEAGTDAAGDAGDASVVDEGDGAVDAEAGVLLPDVFVPTLVQIWARWPMPNPDASIGGDSSLLLPNPMQYAPVIDAGSAADAGDAGDGGDAGGGGDAGEGAASEVYSQVHDVRTGLTWEAADDLETDVRTLAARHCYALGMRLPTRIELVSLIDFTQTPTIDNAVFPGTSGSYWTSSVYSIDGGSVGYWFVDFGDGTVTHGAPMSASVRCVMP